MRDRLHRTGVKKVNHLVKTASVTIACLVFSFALLITVICINVTAQNKYLNENVVSNYIQVNYQTGDDDNTILLDRSTK